MEQRDMCFVGSQIWREGWEEEGQAKKEKKMPDKEWTGRKRGWRAGEQKGV